nr:hypothetical protein [Lysinibacillus timonensis]
MQIVQFKLYFNHLVKLFSQCTHFHLNVPYALQISNKGVCKAIFDNEGLKHGVNIAKGFVTHKVIAKDLGYHYVTVEKALEKELELQVK